MYTQFVAESIGKLLVRELKRSDIKRFYNMLADDRKLKIATIDNIHTVLHQVLQLAVEDNYVRNNVSDNLLKELKQSHHFEEDHKRALTVPEQELFLEFLKSEKTQYHHWYPIFAVMVGTGMRVGEICGSRWQDIDMETGLKEAFQTEKEYQNYNDLKCNVSVDGFTDFIFINRFGKLQHQGTLNKALKRIIRDCNDMQLLKKKKNPVLLPNLSCHSLRHTFITRLVEAGVNIKVIQELCGHTRSDVTLDIYTTVTKELKQREFGNFEEKLKLQKQEWDVRINSEGEDEQ